MVNKYLVWKEIWCKSSQNSVFPEDIISYTTHPCWLNAVGGSLEAHQKRGVPLFSLLSFFPLPIFCLIVLSKRAQFQFIVLLLGRLRTRSNFWSQLHIYHCIGLRGPTLEGALTSLFTSHAWPRKFQITCVIAHNFKQLFDCTKYLCSHCRQWWDNLPSDFLDLTFGSGSCCTVPLISKARCGQYLSSLWNLNQSHYFICYCKYT